MKCSLGCHSIETQYHICEQCAPVIDQIRLEESIKLDKIYGTLDSSLEEQKLIIQSLIQSDDSNSRGKKPIVTERRLYSHHHPPGGVRILLLAASNI